MSAPDSEDLEGAAFLEEMRWTEGMTVNARNRWMSLAWTVGTAQAYEWYVEENPELTGTEMGAALLILNNLTP